jgi:hypothetical protein
LLVITTPGARTPMSVNDFTHINFFVIFHAASVSQHGHDNAFL